MRSGMAATGHRAPSVMLYTHDAGALGHLSRTFALARRLCDRRPDLRQLIVTGSPLAHTFRLPNGADYIKLPSALKVDEAQYRPLALPISSAEILDLRREILLSVARHVRPDALIVDSRPAGLQGDVVPALRHLKASAPRTHLILGLRDIADEARRVRQAWARDGIYELLDDLYDLILVYGQSDVYDVVTEYGLSPRAAAKVRYVGYLGRAPDAQAAEQIRAELRLRTARLVLVTVGGGRDGYPLLRAMLEAVRPHAAAGFDCLLVGGPLLPPEHRRELLEQLPTGAAVRWLDFVEELPAYLAAADAVVSMGGYNAICEILSAGRPALIVPRVALSAEQRLRADPLSREQLRWAAALSREQLLRAEALSRRGLVRLLHPAELTPARLLAEIHGLLTDPPRAHASVSLDGLAAVADELASILHPATRSPASAGSEAD